MNLNPSTTRRFVAVLLILLAASYSIFTAYTIITAPAEYRVQYVPDDAFYYMVLARNFVTLGQWTFDSGISLTSGFHPLHAYTLAGLYSLLQPAPERFVQLTVLVSFLAALPAGVAAAVFSWRSKHLFPSMLLLLFALSRNYTLNVVSGLEWGWVVSLSTLYCVLLFTSHSPSSKVAYALLFMCGFLGSLARTDFGLLPAAFVAASLFWIRTLRGRRMFTLSLAGLGGSSFGVAATFLHNYIMTGQAMQSSAQMKSFWLSGYEIGITPAPIIAEIVTLFGDYTRDLALCSAFISLLVILGVYRFLHTSPALLHGYTDNVPPVTTRHRVLWLGCLLAIVGYVALYARTPASLQNWYTANLIVPVFLVLSLPVVYTGWRQPLSICATLVALILLLGLQIVSAYSFLRIPEWPHQVAMYRAGHYLREHPLPGIVGSWNAGIINFYEGGHVVNLDGLVNNDIYAYAVQNDLPSYIDTLPIEHLADFELMFQRDYYLRRGGYDVPSFLSRLEPVRRFDHPGNNWGSLIIYRIAPAEEGMSEP